MRPWRVCAEPGCATLVRKGRCDVHEPHVPTPTKQERDRKPYPWRWRKYSQAYRKTHPYCRPCEQAGRVTLSYAVDHIIPVSGPDDPRFWEPENHQPICHSCHSTKTNRQDGGFGRDRRACYILTGLPGSGKSTWAAAQGHPTLSTDEWKKQRHSSTALQSWNALEARWQAMLAKDPVLIWDGCTATRQERAQRISQARAKGFRVTIVWLKTPLDACAEERPRGLVADYAHRFEVPNASEADDLIVVERTPGADEAAYTTPKRRVWAFA